MPPAPLRWYRTIDAFLKSCNFTSSPREPCVYIRRCKHNPDLIAIIYLFVDDFLLTGSDKAGIHEIVSRLNSRFKIRNLGFPIKFLGIQIDKRSDNSLFLHQRTYIQNVLNQFGMSECYSSPIPMVPIANHRVENLTTEIVFPYKQAIGCLQYLATCTRIDIAFAVSYVARFQADPKPLHWKLVQRIFRYLQGTKNLGLRFSCPSNTHIDAHADADADHAADLTRKSTTGYIVRMYGCPVAWCSRLQRCISENTSEAELKSVCETTHDILFLHHLTSELLYPVQLPITLYEDNVGALRHCHLSASRGRIKHLELRYFKVQEYVNERLLCIQKVSSADQLANILTKPLLETQFSKMLKLLMSS